MRINKPFLERGLDVDLVQRNKLFLCDRLAWCIVHLFEQASQVQDAVAK